jgi:hypothetical protein
MVLRAIMTAKRAIPESLEVRLLGELECGGTAVLALRRRKDTRPDRIPRRHAPAAVKRSRLFWGPDDFGVRSAGA